jgi:aryl-alcohol dehydrogenase-like predicted oxidoreductase
MEPMRQSLCGNLRTSVLGFGCGSVLGRVGRAASLRAMNAAWDAGITFFDTARSYGYGKAEAVLGEFLQDKRDQAVIATKYGIAPQQLTALKRVAVPVVRAALRVPGVRSVMRRGGSGHPVQFGEFSAAGLRTSVETSLRELRTDRIDVLFLHEATAAAIDRQDLMAEVASLIQAGKVLRAGLYAGPGVIAEGMARGPATLGAMQFGADLFDPVVADIAANNARGALLIGNHPFGSPERVARIRAILAAISRDETAPVELREKLGGADGQMLLEAILGMVLSCGIHTLVFSMMHPDHLRANVRAVENNRFTADEVALLCRRLLVC